MPRRDTGEIFRMTRPGRFVSGMILFLIAVGLIAASMLDQVMVAFSANYFLNGLILSVLAIGIVYSFAQVFRLNPSVKWMERFRMGDPGSGGPMEFNPPELLAPMAAMLRDRNASMSLSATALGSILDSIGSRLDESREISRYMIGLLVFLGLLGTFWGLLQTITSVSDSIRALAPSGAPSEQIFEELIAGLEGPLSGMAIAFSSSLFGLSGSLVLGFLDLRAGQAQNRFYNELEEYLSTRTQVSSDGTTPAGGGGGNGGDGETLNALFGAIRSLEQAIVNMDTSRSMSAPPSATMNNATEESVEALSPAIERLRRPRSRKASQIDKDDTAEPAQIDQRQKLKEENPVAAEIARHAIARLKQDRAAMTAPPQPLAAAPRVQSDQIPPLLLTDTPDDSIEDIRNDIRILTKTIVSLADRSE